MSQNQLSKIDSFLNIEILKDQNKRLNVSLRIKSKLTDKEVVKFIELGFADANTQRRIFFANLSEKEIKMLVDLDKVVSISLVNSMNIKNE